MENLSCSVTVVLAYMLRAFGVVLLVYALLSWVPSLRGRWSVYLDRIVEPVLLPVQRLIPPIGGFSIAFIVLIYLVQWLASAIVPSACRI